MRPKPAARIYRKPTAKPSRRTKHVAVKRNGRSLVRPHPAPTTAGHGGNSSTRSPTSGVPFPWGDILLRFVDHGVERRSRLQLEYRGRLIDNLPLAPAQATILRHLLAKVFANPKGHRDKRLASSVELLKLLEQQHFDPTGEKTWALQDIYDLAYKMRRKLRNSQTAQWLKKKLGVAFDFGMWVLAHDSVVLGYRIAVPPNRIEIIVI